MNKEIPRLLPTLLAAAGLVVCGVLEWIHIKTYLLPSSESFCAVNESFDCGTVALSRFSVVLGVPMPLWGLAGFFAMAAAAWRRLWLLWPLAGLAALASVALLVEELVHVGSVCLMCEAVHVLAIALAVLAWRGNRRHGEATTLARAFPVFGVPLSIVVATWLIVPPYWTPLTWQDEVPHPHGLTEDGHPWVGAEQPVVVIEEFVDYGCPHCAIATNQTRARLARDGDALRVIRRHQPRMRCNDRNHGCLTLRAALCAGQQDRFWEMDSWLFVHAPGRSKVDVSEGARAIGLEREAFERCLESPEIYATADDEARTARKLRIRVTPTYRVDGEKITPEELRALLDERL